MEAMTDATHWQTALLTLDWGDDLTRLERWIRGHTFIPHWTEFERNWLRRCSEHTRMLSLSKIINGCMDAWISGSNEYYVKHPNVASWSENDGLGHYIRVLTMIVRENMATNAVWAIVETKGVRRYFEKALVLVNCMKEEWNRKGSLYQHYRSIQTQKEARVASLNNGRASTSTSHTGMNGTASVASSGPSRFASTINGISRPSAVEGAERLASVTNKVSEPSVAPSTSENASVNNLLRDPESELGRSQRKLESERSQDGNAEGTRSGINEPPRPASANGIASSKTTQNDKTQGLTPSKSGATASSMLPDQEYYRPPNGLTAQRRMSDGAGQYDANIPILSQAGHASLAINGKRALTELGSRSHDDHDTTRKRTRLTPEDSAKSAHHHSDREIKREEDTATKPLDRASAYFKDPTQSAPHWNYYRSADYERNKYHRDTDESARRAPTASNIRTNGSGGAAPGSFRDKPLKSMDDLIRETCPYELNDTICPVPDRCMMRQICVDYTRNRPCGENCVNVHVLRTCRFKAQEGACQKRFRPCTYGHEDVRMDRYYEPERYHVVDRHY